MILVHILMHGRPFCGQPGMPSEWPDGEKGVGFNDPELDQATCEACKENHARWKRGEPMQ